MAIDRMDTGYTFTHARIISCFAGQEARDIELDVIQFLAVASFPEFYQRPRRHFVIDDDVYWYYHYISRGHIHAPVNCNSATTSVGHFHYDSLSNQRPQCRHRSAQVEFHEYFDCARPSGRWREEIFRLWWPLRFNFGDWPPNDHWSVI